MSNTDSTLHDKIKQLRARNLKEMPVDMDSVMEVVDGLADMLRPFADLHAAYLEYRAERLDAGLRPHQLLDFTVWIERYGEDPDVLAKWCKTAADVLGVKGEAE